MRSRTHKLGLILLVLVLLVGCTHSGALEASYVLHYHDKSTVSKDDSVVFHIDNTTPYEELITKTVDIHEFAQYCDPDGCGININDVMARFGIECLRETDAGALYSVHKVEQGGLIYVFYNNYDWDTDIAGNGIRRWFYMRDRLSFSDFDKFQENIATIEDVIKVNDAEQIFLNIYHADPLYFDEGVFYTSYYLTDGILDVMYTEQNGELVFTKKFLTEDFDLLGGEAVYTPYDAHILDIDWVK